MPLLFVISSLLKLMILYLTETDIMKKQQKERNSRAHYDREKESVIVEADSAIKSSLRKRKQILWFKSRIQH